MQTNSSRKPAGQLPKVATAFIPKEEKTTWTTPRLTKTKAMPAAAVRHEDDTSVAEEQERMLNLKALRMVLKYKGNWGSLSTKSNSLSTYRVPPGSPRKSAEEEEVMFSSNVVFQIVAPHVELLTSSPEVANQSNV